MREDNEDDDGSPGPADRILFLLPRHQAMEEALKVMNIPLHQVRFYEYQQHVRYHFKDLRLVDWPSQPRHPAHSHMARGSPMSVFFPPRRGLQLLSYLATGRPYMGVAALQPHQRRSRETHALYVSRNGTRSQMRRVLGSHLLVRVLHEELGGEAYTIFTGHQLKFDAQIRMFKKATIVAGGHGE
jgi:hypothetical protein